MLGNPCQMNEILKISKEKSIPILEDACESLGAKYDNKFVGTHGNVGVFSLDFAKTITTGEGGLIVSNNKKIINYCREFHDHGHQNNKKKPRGKDTRKIWGLNLRMTELQAAVGIAQLSKLKFIVKQNQINKNYIKKRIIKNNFFEYRLINSEEELSDTLILILDNKKRAQALTKYLQKYKIGTKNLPDSLDWHFAGNWKHIFKYSKKYKKNYKNCWKKSRDLLERSIALPILIKSSKRELDFVIKVINNFFKTL